MTATEKKTILRTGTVQFPAGYADGKVTYRTCPARSYKGPEGWENEYDDGTGTWLPVPAGRAAYFNWN